MLVKIVILSVVLFLLPTITLARTTPEDIVNSKRQIFKQRVQSYSSENKKKLEDFSQKIADFNKQKTTELEFIMLVQGSLLDEYVRRNNIKEDGGKDGVNRSKDPVAVARIEITRAHEAIAYQAAKSYIYNLTSEGNIRGDSLNLISTLQTDLNYARNTVIKSQSILKGTISD